MHAYRNLMIVVSDDDARVSVDGARDGNPIEVGPPMIRSDMKSASSMQCPHGSDTCGG